MSIKSIEWDRSFVQWKKKNKRIMFMFANRRKCICAKVNCGGIPIKSLH